MANLVDFLQKLRLQNIFNPMLDASNPSPYGNDLPSQGGITGTMYPNSPVANPFPQPTFGSPQERQTPLYNSGGGGAQQPIPEGSGYTGAAATGIPAADPRRIPQMFDQLYHPETGAVDKFNQMLGQYPQQQQPGKLRRIGGAIAGALTDLGNVYGNRTGAKGTDVVNEVLGRTQHERDVEDWKTQMGPAQQAANLERYENVNRRTQAYQTVTKQLDYEANLAKERKDEAAAQRSAEHQELIRLKEAGMQFKISGNKLIMLDPKGKNPPVITTIDPSKMSDLTKMYLTRDFALELAGERGNQTRLTNEAKPDKWVPWNVALDPSKPTELTSVWLNTETQETKPITIGGKSPVLARPIGGTGTGTAKQPPNIGAIQGQAQQVLDLINNEILDKTDSLRPEVRQALNWGRLNPWERWAPGTDFKKGDAAIRRLKAGQIISLIAELKSQSKTGATGFGTMSDRDIAVLDAAASKLDTALDDATFNAEVVRIKSHLRKIIQPVTGMNPTTVGTKPTAEDLIRKYSVP